MKLPGPPLPRHNLAPGELLVTQQPQWVYTLLGSCVAVTMFSARFHVAAICHGMLPRPGRYADSHACETDPFKYLSCVIPAMRERFRFLGLGPRDIEVKMFGGANVIRLGGEPHDERWIGTANIATARQLLEEAGLTLKAERVGGARGCKIFFNTETGEVLHKPLRHSIPRA